MRKILINTLVFGHAEVTGELYLYNASYGLINEYSKFF